MKHIVLFTLLVALLTACAGAPAAPATEPPAATSTTMPAEVVMEPTATPPATVAPTTAPMVMEAGSFEVSVAQYFMDSAGFHGMAETLAETKTVDPTYFSTVNRVQKVLMQTVWPTELDEQAQGFIESLGTFAAALEADKVDDAIEASDVVHDAQHELSHSIDDWIGTATTTSVEADPFNVSVAQYFMDSAGFHGMAETLAESKTVDPTSLSIVNRVKKVLTQTVWPTELDEQAQGFITALGTLATALEADKVDDAIEASDVVHDAQHELSHSIDDWMGTATTTSAEADPFKVSVAQYFMDFAGFHGMADTLAESKTIDPTFLSIVNRVRKVLTQTVWSAELNEQAQGFIESLGIFAAALEADDVDGATEASDTVHDAEHELSHSIDHWMESNAQDH